MDDLLAIRAELTRLAEMNKLQGVCISRLICEINQKIGMEYIEQDISEVMSFAGAIQPAHTTATHERKE
jgi:hypothetical protein